MKLTLVAIVSAFALVGCGATIQTSNPRSNMIHAVSAKQAQPLADSECAKHGRFARLVGTDGNFNFSFHCVE